MIPHQPPPHHHHPELHQPPSPTSPIQVVYTSNYPTPTPHHHNIKPPHSHAPMHMHRPKHGPACPSSQTKIRPLLTCRHSDYMILLLVLQILICDKLHQNLKLDFKVFFFNVASLHTGRFFIYSLFRFHFSYVLFCVLRVKYNNTLIFLAPTFFTRWRRPFNQTFFI